MTADEPPSICALCDRPVDPSYTGTVRYRRHLMHDTCLFHAAHTAAHTADVREWLGGDTRDR